MSHFGQLEERDSVFGTGKGKLLQEGAEAQGVVTELERRALANGGHAETYHVTVRVQFGDGSTAEIKRKLNENEAGKHFTGAILPLRYDPGDHSKIEIDLPKLKVALTAKRALSEQAAAERIAKAESEAAQQNLQ
jgi:hypothetical protein